MVAAAASSARALNAPSAAAAASLSMSASVPMRVCWAFSVDKPVSLCFFTEALHSG